MPRPQIELLAPARDAAIGIEAVNHGADAVYIGGPGFGARDKAANSVADIARLSAHAHRWGARVFVALNTILRDDELEPARRLAWSLYEAGVDAMIVQDMGLLELDLPPIQLHASTQTDIRSPAKARFLQDVGFSQMVLARELDLEQIRAIAAQAPDAVLEFFVHGALCVAYSGQCYISHAVTGRSANRGSCSQECRQPYTLLDGGGRILAHEKHLLSLKDNDQSANLALLVDAGIRSFKIEGRYKDMATVKNVTAHYRRLLDALLDGQRDLRPASSGRCSHSFTPQPEQGYNRGGTDYFVRGRQIDIGAFDSPKHAGRALGWVARRVGECFELETDDPAAILNNGDALTWWDLQGELQGVAVNTASAVAGPGGRRRWLVLPNQPLDALKDLRPGTTVSRNRDMAWERLLARPSAERRIAVDLHLVCHEGGVELALKDADGHRAQLRLDHAWTPARELDRARTQIEQGLARLGDTIFSARRVRLAGAQTPFLPSALVNRLRREGIAALEAVRAAAFERLPRAQPVQPPVPYPEDTLSYLANVYNARAAAFYARHGVRVVEPAFESHQALGEVSLMITRHCVRYSLSLCPRQAKGVTGVQGTLRADPLTLVHEDLRYTLRFDCKACEMHVEGAIQPHVLAAAPAALRIQRSRPAA